MSDNHRTHKTFDKLLEAKDAGAVTASAAAQVGGSAKVIDLGAGRVWSADLIADVSAIDVASTDEIYRIELQGSNDASFATGVVVLGTLTLGATAATGESAASGVGRYVLPCTNVKKDVRYRYVRAFHRIAGTTPSINYKAYLAKY